MAKDYVGLRRELNQMQFDLNFFAKSRLFKFRKSKISKRPKEWQSVTEKCYSIPFHFNRRISQWILHSKRLRLNRRRKALIYRVEKAWTYKNHQKLCFVFHGDSRNRSDCNFFVITAIKPVDKPQVIKYNIGTTIKSAWGSKPNDRTPTCFCKVVMLDRWCAT